MKKYLSITFAACIMASPIVSQAAFVFTNVGYTSNTVTFTINGDMSGYVDPGSANSNQQFSIRYTPGMVNSTSGLNFAPNTWSQDVFDNKTITSNGNTGFFTTGTTIPFSWSAYNGNLSNAFATNNIVTLTLSQNLFNPGFSASDISFWWGNGHSDNNPTFLGGGAPAAVPLPAAVWLLGSGLLGLIGMRKRT